MLCRNVSGECVFKAFEWRHPQTVNFDSSHPFSQVLSYETLDFQAWRRASISHLPPMNPAPCSAFVTQNRSLSADIQATL